MDINDFRRRNLKRLIKECFESQADFARAHEMPPPNVTQLLNGKRAFGNEMARRFEEKSGYRPGWLDEEIPLTEEALSLARKFMELSKERQPVIWEHLMDLLTIQNHEQEAATARLSASTRAVQ